MRHRWLPLTLAPALLTVAVEAGAVASAELYQNQTYTYGRFEARVRFAAGDGVISSFFLWKPGSEMPGTFWNELDFEKLGADCRVQTNPLYGLPVVDRSEIAVLDADLCGEYHTYTFEWTPSYIAYLVDGVEVRRDGEETAAAFAENAASGMQIRFNIWPGDASFGGNFDAAILPVYQFISWVQYSSFADGGFTLEWRQEFDGPELPSGWATGNWLSPKNLSTHAPANVTFTAGLSVLSLTADDATGFSGPPPADTGATDTADPDSSAGSGGDSSTGVDSNTAGGADVNTGGASPTSTAPAAGAAAEGAPPAGADRPASSASGTCSHVARAPTHSGGAAWLVLGGVGLLIGARQRRCLERRRRGSTQSSR